MADDEQFSLCWNNFNSNLSAGFHESLCRGDLVDVTLAAEGQLVKAHRLVLSVCSPYFRKMFTQMPANQHAFVFLKDVSHTALKDLIQFMYCGEVNVKQEALPAFISTAEALQIKGLTDSDPAPSSSPAEPSTPTPQIQQITSPRVRQQRTSQTRSYKIETIDDSDEKPATQIVIQTTAAPQATIAQQQASHLQQHTHHHSSAQQISSVPATATVVTHKRPAQRSIGSAPHIKRTKSTIDPLDASESATSQITVQATVVDSKAQQSDTEYIDMPMEIPTKSEPDYSEDAGEVNATDHEATYVEDDSYGDMRYDESYFTENEDGTANASVATSVTGGNSGGVNVSNASVATTSTKALIKQQTSFSDSSYVDAADQSNNDAQDVELSFIETPWATPCLVLKNFIYNCHSRKNNKEYWRCHNYSKKIQTERCRSRCVLENGRLKALSGGEHNHPPHTEKIEKMMERSRIAAGISRFKIARQRSLPVRLEVKSENDYDEIMHTQIMLLHE
ncbi:modifier of mdg4 isoform X5 [Teleopsis dalmanni]|uniref:modifier of mdg4 isoform X5 n=1 Tax=Teleopsis dalmanni TaxID=139649 RepID=UPI0018CCE002|nr:modifier of mdg4 isoform X5 [Teleopsis dalmanni]